MSTQHRLYKNTIKKIKIDGVDQNIYRIAEYKMFAILKYCKENGIQKQQLDMLLTSNDLLKLGMSYFFLTSIRFIIIEF